MTTTHPATDTHDPAAASGTAPAPDCRAPGSGPRA